MFTTTATIVSGAIGLAIIGLGARFILAPGPAAAGYGIPVHLAATQPRSGAADPWLSVKGVRDIASGLFLWILLLSRASHLLGAFMVAATLIPIGDAVIVLRSGGTRAVAFGIHGVTAVIMVAAGAALLIV